MEKEFIDITVPVGGSVTLSGGRAVTVRKAMDGCKGCVFNTASHKGCPYVPECMGHLRPDGQSVIFAESAETE
jgi:hypothetical protein